MAVPSITFMFEEMNRVVTLEPRTPHGGLHHYSLRVFSKKQHGSDRDLCVANQVQLTERLFDRDIGDDVQLPLAFGPCKKRCTFSESMSCSDASGSVVSSHVIPRVVR